MKALFKYGVGLAAGLLLSGAAIAGESVPIEDRDAFEQQYIECIMSGAKDDCMVLIFSSLPVPRNKDKGEIVEMLNKYYLKEIAHQPVYRVHVIERVMKAGVFDNRSYLIERDDGSLVGLYVSFRNIKDKWFVSKFTLNLSYGYIFKLLGMPFEYSENKK